MVAFLLNKYVIGAVAGLVLITSLSLGAYLKGRHDKGLEMQAALKAATIEAQRQLIEQERKWANAKQDIENGYESERSALDTRYRAAVADAGRLRVKVRKLERVSQAASSAGQSDAANSAWTDGDREGEIDLDRVATETIRLGRDLDECRATVAAWQALERSRQLEK